MKEDCFHLGIKAIIQNETGNILLLKTNPDQLRGYEGEGYWDIPGGRIHKDSTIEETLRRELKEETGITSIKTISPFKMVLSNIRIPMNDAGESVGLILSAHICTVDSAETITLSHEHIASQWFDPTEAAHLLEHIYPIEFTQAIRDL
ncbi:NUDIX hydrolase [candidate division WWE3 bacterium]|uniref:NUDIX hydrolase n=1 Tax=candidate division WWE3 bacterium TaxID=2053526 RepID=A0A955RP08_UNCKA|nr:NUDIX hydrolase [candidate division WWE3 bacterium]